MLLLLVGAAVLRISLFSDLYLRYVQAGLRPYLVASGVLLILLALAAGTRTALTARKKNTPDDRHDHPAEDESDHDHSHAAGPRVAWLLAVPALALLCFPPPALGSYSAAREETRSAEQYAGVGTFPALPAGDPVELTLAEFSGRAAYDSTYSLKGRTVRLTGFVTRGDGGTWYVTRLLVTCCAADATTVKAEIRGAEAPATDTWVTVTGTWHPRGELGTDAAWPPALDATTVRAIAEPSDPYEER